MSDEELDNVSGGGCHIRDGRLVVTTGYECDNFSCVCGGGSQMEERDSVQYSYYVCACCSKLRSCGNCKYCTYEKGLWLCNNENNRK